jgi:dTDP-4-amino-4,6-dideoxygalactose transaminase
MERLQALGVATRPGTHAVHMLGLYRQRFGFSPDDFPAARDADAYSIALPLHNKMTEDDYRYVAMALHEATLCAG